jgi:hypothetical protein
MIAFAPQAGVSIPGKPGFLKAGKPIKLKAKGETPASALAQAAGIAKTVANNPYLAAVLPPGTGAAITAVDYLARSAAAGKLSSAAKKVVGKGAKRLKSALSKLW